MFGACPIPVRQVLVGGLPDHWEGKTSLGPFRGVAEEGGRGTNSLIKVLPRNGPGGAPLWGGNLGSDVNDDAKSLGFTRGVIAAGGGDEGSEAGGIYLAKIGSREGTPGNRDKTSLVIN